MPNLAALDEAVVGTFEGDPLMSSQVEELEVDPEIDEADFERPQQ